MPRVSIRDTRNLRQGPNLFATVSAFDLSIGLSELIETFAADLAFFLVGRVINDETLCLAALATGDRRTWRRRLGLGHGERPRRLRLQFLLARAADPSFTCFERALADKRALLSARAALPLRIAHHVEAVGADHPLGTSPGMDVRKRLDLVAGRATRFL